MNIKLIVVRVICIMLVLLLGACSNKSNKARDVSVADDYDAAVVSTGLGEDSSFNGQDRGLTYTTKAPHNQIYYFDFNATQVSRDYIASINAQTKYLKRNPGAMILLAGHTDERGSREYNVGLGERRANRIADLIRLAGVNSKQIRVVSYGKERPAVVGHDESAHKLNRRVELTYEATR